MNKKLLRELRKHKTIGVVALYKDIYNHHVKHSDPSDDYVHIMHPSDIKNKQFDCLVIAEHMTVNLALNDVHPNLWNAARRYNKNKKKT